MKALIEVDPDVAYPATVPEMGESWLHMEVRTATYVALRGRFAGRPGCFVGSDLNVYYRPRPQSAFVAPDVFVCFGADPGPWERAASYRLWDAGAPPPFVLEIASENTKHGDLEDKPHIYLEMGVSEYWRVDPTGGDFFAPMLQGDRLAGDAWAPVEVTAVGDGLHGHSRVLGLDLHAEPGRLRLRDPKTGLWLPDYEETRHALDAEITARRAAQDRAECAEAEVAALRARLNELNGDAAR